MIKITKTGIERLGPSVINLAKHENLEGHARSVKIRLKRKNNWLAGFKFERLQNYCQTRCLGKVRK